MTNIYYICIINRPQKIGKRKSEISRETIKVYIDIETRWHECIKLLYPPGLVFYSIKVQERGVLIMYKYEIIGCTV